MSKNKSKSKIGLYLIIALVVIVVGSIVWYYTSISSIDNNDEEVEVIIPMGSGTDKIAKILKEKHLINNELSFKLFVKLNKISGFKAGTYYLKQSMNTKEITETLKTGIMFDPNQLNITYIEGKNMRNLAKVIAENTNNTEKDVFDKLNDEKYIDSLIDKYWFITDEIKNDDIYYSLEGYLFPDTYTIKNKDATVEEIFEKMLNQTEKILNQYKDEIEETKYTVHELLTIASIIELESMTDVGRKDVASVIYNRLESNMAIQSDVTTYYAIKVDVGERDLYQKEINKANPYNTRGPNMEGKLPVGPMCSVSRNSIEAAIEPNNTEYYFFVADKNGKLYFTKTNEEHNRIINQLMQDGLWLEY